MDSSILLQLIITVGAIFTSIFAMFRYFIQQSVKREKTMLEYFEQKNGHMERISKDFTKSSNKMARAISKMATKLEVHSIKTSKKK